MSLPEVAVPPLVVRAGGSDQSLPPGPSYLIGRDPECAIVIDDASVSWQHAVLRVEDGRWVLADNGSTNGTYVRDQRIDRIELEGECLVRLCHPAEGPALSCRVSAPAPPTDLASLDHTLRVGRAPDNELGPTAATADGEGLLEIPYAVRWLVPRGERFANFDILNDNDTQLDYYRRFGHVYAVGIPTKKWRLVMVSDPGLLDEVAADEEQFGKRVEEINFFDQLSNSRGGGISVIGDGEHYNRVRRVMLPWYSPQHQRTQLERMKDQARKLVAAWSALPEGESLDARTWMERYTLEVSGRGACAYDFGLLDGHGGGGDPHPFAAAVPASTKESILRVAEPRPDFTMFAGRARRQRKKAYRAHNTELFRTADALVRGRTHTAPLGQQTDLLSRLLSTPDPETGQFLDTETVRDQILMHLSNGFNGPSITGAWLAYILATRPDVTAKVMAEIDAITGGDPDYDLQYDDLAAMTYVTQVIKETMRIYPPLPVTIRRSLKDGTLGRYRIRKGDIILVGTLAAQRDPRYWGPYPDRFDPEQFAMEKVVDRPRHAFIPFSIGKRQCMAQEVTFMMLRVVLFEICRHYRLRLAPGATVTKNTVVSTKPAAVPVILRRRELKEYRRTPAEVRERPEAPAPLAPQSAFAAPEWGEPTEIPESSAYRHLVIAYGSNFGANKELAERFARRSEYYGYTSDVITLNELAQSPPRTQPWLLVVMTSTYTSNPPYERGRVQGAARAHRTRRGDLAELPVPGLGPRQHPVERVPGLPALRARQAVRARRRPARRVCLRRRRLAGVGAAALGLEQRGLARPPRAVRGTADPGRGRPRGRREGRHRRSHRHRFRHRDAAVPLRRGRRAAAGRAGDEHHVDHAPDVVGIAQAVHLAARTGRGHRLPPAGAARPDHPHERRRDRHGRGARRGMPRASGGGIAEADQAPRGQPAARRRLSGRRSPRRLPEERRGAGRAARPAPRRRARRAVHGAQDGGRPRGAEGRCAPGP